MNKEKLISIITVTYNAENTISKTLSSLKAQSYQDFEHIVIDGNSSDSTLKIVNEFGLPQTILRSEPDKGLYDAMNKGLKLASGKYVLFLNSGDVFHSFNTLEHYAKEALKGKDIIYGDTIIVNEKGEKIADRHLSAPEVLNKKTFSEGMLVCHQAFMAKKELSPFYDLRYKFSADYDWSVKCIGNSQSDNCENLHEVTIDYLNEGITDKNKWRSLRERFSIMKRHYGLPLTAIRHLTFIFRALKRGKL
ncbi:MAG: glycosyltransferase [Muribaculaceae bacterium]|nr:glycosyltransferase [Muribaculaceae bacterium]